MREIRQAECHPDRQHRAKGLCASCYALSFYRKNPQARRAKIRERERKSPEKVAAVNNAYRRKHSAESAARSRAWKTAHPERTREATRRYSQRHPDKVRAATKRWRELNPDKIKAKTLKRKYGLTLTGYRELLERQGGRCALCGGTMNPPYVDHDHETQRVRALLCQSCNVGLGSFKDRPELLRHAAHYVEWHRRAQHGTPMSVKAAA